MTASYFIIVFILCLIVLFINIREIRLGYKLLNTTSNKHYLLATQITLFFAVFFRLIYLEYPYGINLDEAVAGYDAWCLAHYRIDQHLYPYPVYLKSWGSGQSALYAYLSAPLVNLFGLSLPIHRLPMAIISSASLLCFYFALKKAKMKMFFIFICILIFSLDPWHFTKSRWALDCNLAPDLLLISTCFTILAFYSHKVKQQVFYFTLSFIFLGLTAYGYAVSWFMLPLYASFIIAILYKENKINIKQALGYSAITLTIVLPLLLFALRLANIIDIPSLGPLSITKLNEGRHESTNIFNLSGNELYSYAWTSIKGIVSGFDHKLTNSFPFTGQFYNYVGWFFVFIGLFRISKDKNFYLLDKLFLFWLIACIPIIIFVLYNVNRWNMIWLPLIYFFTRGIYFCISKRKIYEYAFYVVFAGLTIFFAANYTIVHHRAFIPDVEDVVKITSKKNIKTVHFTSRLQYPAILFYDPISPEELNRTKVEINPASDFIHLSKFGKYNLDVVTPITPEAHTAYVILTRHLNTLGIDHSQFNIHRGEWLTVLWND